MDDDKNRKLSLEEFRKGVEEYGLSFSKAEIEELFRRMDTDRDGSIDYEEFVRKLRVSPVDLILRRKSRSLRLATDE